MTGSTHVRVTLALVLAVSLAGCGATNLPFLGGDDAASDGRAKDIAANATAELRTASAYNFTMTQIVRFGQNHVNMSAAGSVNHSSQRLRMEVVQSVRTNTTNAKEFSTVYLLGNTRCWRDPSVDDGWNQTQLQGAWGAGLSPSAQSTILNASGTDAVLRENETIRGRTVSVVEIRPDPGTLKRVVANQTDTDLAGVTVTNATLTQYVAQKSGRLLRSELHVEYRQNGRRTVMDLTMTYSDHGNAGPITAPTNEDGQSLCDPNATAAVVAV